MLSSEVSLVKYDNGILISTKDARGKGRKALDARGKATPTEEVLNSILPPREWTESGQLWVQYVSSTPATRSDVIALQKQLDQELQTRKARETGICPIREELYAQCFDELIRQVTINCSERGMLLLCVRDDIRTTIAAYQTLYDSCIAFGMRQALQAEQKKTTMQARVKQLEAEVKLLQEQVRESANKCASMEKEAQLRREEALRASKQEADFYRRKNADLKEKLEKLLSVPTRDGAPDSVA